MESKAHFSHENSVELTLIPLINRIVFFCLLVIPASVLLMDIVSDLVSSTDNWLFNLGYLAFVILPLLFILIGMYTIPIKCVMTPNSLLLLYQTHQVNYPFTNYRISCSRQSSLKGRYWHFLDISSPIAIKEERKVRLIVNLATVNQLSQWLDHYQASSTC